MTSAARLLAIHADVDAAVGELERRHRSRLQCRAGCADCCVDDLTVFEVEAGRIRERYGALLERESPHPTGACAFLDDERRCRIYEARPYVCRTQGLPLRWLDTDASGATVEMRDICPLNEVEDAPLTALPAEACWTLGEVEGRLAQLQVETRGMPPRRVALRSLFRRS